MTKIAQRVEKQRIFRHGLIIPLLPRIPACGLHPGYNGAPE
jgi:hypothetical protein